MTMNLAHFPFDLPAEPKGHSVTMSNAIIVSAQQLNLSQKRLIMLALSRVNPKSEALPPMPIRVSAQDYGRTFGVDMGNAYNELRTAADGILKAAIVVPRIGPGSFVDKYPWLSVAKYAHGQGWVELEFNEKIAPFLVALKSRFTSYYLEQAAAFGSVYSWRFLEYFQMFQRNGWWEVGLDEFNTVMDTPHSYRANFAQIRRKIIVPSIAELQDKDSWEISWKPQKFGRKVIALRFDFARNAQGVLF